MSGKASRDKGNRSERELVKLLDGARIRGRVLTARRVPLSGAMSSTGFGGDLLVGEECGIKGYGSHGDDCPFCMGTNTKNRTEQEWEVKRRAHGFRTLYKWLEDAAVLAVRSDRHGWLVVMRLEDLVEPAQGDTCESK